MFAKRPKYLRNDVDLWQMAQICGEMTYLLDKRLKNVESELEIFEMAKIIGKWLRHMVHGLSI